MSSAHGLLLSGIALGIALTASSFTMWCQLAPSRPPAPSASIVGKPAAERTLDAALQQLVRGNDAQRRGAARQVFRIRQGHERRRGTPPVADATQATRMVPFLLLALDDPLDDVRAVAFAMLEGFGPDAHWASGHVARFATRADSANKRRAAMALWRLTGARTRSLRLLHEVLADAEFAVREAAARDVLEICTGIEPYLPQLGAFGIELLARLDPILATDDLDLRTSVHGVMAQLLR